MLFTLFNVIWGLTLFLFFYNLILFLITLFENRKELYCSEKIDDEDLPTVCIIIPFLNEEKTLARSLNSLANLDYPENKLEIFAIDGNSNDNSFKIAKEFEKYPTIKAFNYKEDKGKYTALNYGISKTKAEIIGCLDADSIVDPSSLKKMVRYFQDREVAAVASAPKIHQPKTIFQHIIQAEFLLEIFIKKCLSLMDSMTVIPGPYSFFRTSVLKKIGGFKEAHKTEDIEITMRLQKNNFKLKNALDVSVYTIGQDTFKKLYKQRLRWNTGYWKNIWDYRVFFNKSYGDLGLLLFLSVFSFFLIFIFIIYSFFNIISSAVIYFQNFSAIEFSLMPIINFEISPLFININLFLFLQLIVILSIFGIILLGKKLSFEKESPLKGSIFFILLFPWLVVIWMASSFYSIAFKKDIKWK